MRGPSSPARAARRPWIAAVGLSVGVHALVLSLQLRPAPQAELRWRAYAPLTLELVNFEPEPAPGDPGEAGESTASELRPAPTPPPASPAPPSLAAPHERKPRPRLHPGPSDTPEAKPSPRPAAKAAGLAMRGLRSQARDHHRDAAGLELEGDASWVEVDGPGAAGPDLEGPSPPGELDDPHAGIVELADGSLGYTDPTGSFNAFIQPDGSVKLQDSKSARVKLCIAMVCVNAGQVKKVEAGKAAPKNTLHVDTALIPLGLAVAWGKNLKATRLEQRFLQRTFELRMGMRTKWQRRQLVRALSDLRAQLDALWKDPSLDDARRKEIYRERWEECDVDRALADDGVAKGVRELNEAARDAARSARRIIESHWRERTGTELFD